MQYGHENRYPSHVSLPPSRRRNGSKMRSRVRVCDKPITIADTRSSCFMAARPGEGWRSPLSLRRGFAAAPAAVGRIRSLAVRGLTASRLALGGLRPFRVVAIGIPLDPVRPLVLVVDVELV